MLVRIFFATSSTYQPGDIVRLAAGVALRQPHAAEDGGNRPKR